MKIAAFAAGALSGVLLFSSPGKGFCQNAGDYDRLRQKAASAASMMREGDTEKAEAFYDQVWRELRETFPLEFCEPEERGRIASLYVGLAMGRGGLRSSRNDVEGALEIYQEAASLVPENAGPFYDAMARSIVGRRDRDKIIERLRSDEALGLDETVRDHVLGRVYASLGDAMNARLYLRRAREAAANSGHAQLLAETDRWVESLP